MERCLNNGTQDATGERFAQGYALVNSKMEVEVFTKTAPPGCCSSCNLGTWYHCCKEPIFGYIISTPVFGYPVEEFLKKVEDDNERT